jgi:hypothetical protein
MQKFITFPARCFEFRSFWAWKSPQKVLYLQGATGVGVPTPATVLSPVRTTVGMTIGHLAGWLSQ